MSKADIPLAEFAVSTGNNGCGGWLDLYLPGITEEQVDWCEQQEGVKSSEKKLAEHRVTMWLSEFPTAPEVHQAIQRIITAASGFFGCTFVVNDLSDPTHG